jgi:DNA-binding NarL/FixJ family response regulator
LTHRVLVVDDYEPWRRHVRSALDQHARFHIVAEAVDGPDAVRQAHALRPDLILLDISLPSMNGIEAARHIVARDPSARILFVSEHRSGDVAGAALETGALGYVIKSDAGRDLLAAMDAAVRGRCFVSSRLAHLAKSPSAGTHGAPEPWWHEVGFYSDERALLDDYTRVAETALARGHMFVLLSCSTRRAQLQDRLRRRGVDLERIIRDGRYRVVDGPELLASFLVDGWPDETLFREAGESMLAATTAGVDAGEKPRRVVVCGECAPRLLREGRGDAAVRVEHLWDEFSRAHQLDTLCGYLSPPHNADDPVLDRIRAEHSASHSR